MPSDIVLMVALITAIFVVFGGILAWASTQQRLEGDVREH